MHKLIRHRLDNDNQITAYVVRRRKNPVELSALRGFLIPDRKRGQMILDLANTIFLALIALAMMDRNSIQRGRDEH